MQSYRHCPVLSKDEKENRQNIRNLGEVFHRWLRVLSRGDWDDLKIDLHVNLHDGFKIQFVGTYRFSHFRVQWFDLEVLK